MMLKSLIYDKGMLERKISELKGIIKYKATDDIAQELFAQLELLQAKNISINTINSQIKINIGEKDVNISTAVVLRDTTKKKIDILTSLIVNSECTLDKLELMRQRDDIYELYVSLANKITLSDLSVKIGE